MSPSIARWQGQARWHELITGRITDSVKLVGPTISCEGSPKDGNVDGEWRTNPHVQSYVLATDQVRHSALEALLSPLNTLLAALVGFAPMREDGCAFECYGIMKDTIQIPHKPTQSPHFYTGGPSTDAPSWAHVRGIQHTKRNHSHPPSEALWKARNPPFAQIGFSPTREDGRV